MSSEIASQGSLSTSNFLTETIPGVSELKTLVGAALDQFGASLRPVFDRFLIDEHEKKAVYGGTCRYCELWRAYINALAAGTPDAEVKL